MLATLRTSALGVLARPVRAPMTGAMSRIPAAVRAYSEQAAGKEGGEAEKKDESANDNGAQDGGAAHEEQLKQKDAKIKELTDDLLYGRAELQNLQRRSAEEKHNASVYGISRLAKDLTSSLDVLDLALRSVPEQFRAADRETSSEAHRAAADLYDGVSLTRKSILDMLRSHGVVPFDPTGEPFDPKLHEALYQAPVPDKKPGSVLECSKLGYKIHDRLLRAAEVGVVQDTS